MSNTDLPLAERIAERISHRIETGDLKPGDRIIEQSIANEFKSSRGPVRDALKILSAREWIEIVPKKGARVARPNAAPMLETILVGGAMLGLAYRFAIMKGTEDQLQTFYQLARKVIALGRDPGSTAIDISGAALKAGRYAVSIADNRSINEIIGPVPQSALSNYASVSIPTAETKAEATELWVELAIAFMMRDGDAAEAIGRRMTKSAYQRILKSQLCPDSS